MAATVPHQPEIRYIADGGLRYTELIAPAIAAIQELAARVEALEQENAELKAERLLD